MAANKPLRSVPFHYPTTATTILAPSSSSAHPSKKPVSSRQAKGHDPQPSRDDLAKLGIKVKDFAYESKLPPVKPWRPLQIQPSAKRLGDDDAAHQRRKMLRRESTEPVLDDDEMEAAMIAEARRHQTRRRGFADLNREGNPSETDIPAVFSQLSDPSLVHSVVSPQSQPPALTMSQSQSQSQKTEPEVVTPIVTPNGSYDWTTRAPRKAIDTTHPETAMDGAESQSVPPIVLSYDDLGLEPPTEAASSQVEPTGTTRASNKAFKSTSSSTRHDNAVSTSENASPTPRRVLARPTPRHSIGCGLSASSLPTPPRTRYQLRARAAKPALPRAAPLYTTNTLKRKRSLEHVDAPTHKASDGSTISSPRSKRKTRSTLNHKAQPKTPKSSSLARSQPRKKSSVPSRGKRKPTIAESSDPPGARRSKRARVAA